MTIDYEAEIRAYVVDLERTARALEEDTRTATEHLRKINSLSEKQKISQGFDTQVEVDADRNQLAAAIAGLMTSDALGKLYAHLPNLRPDDSIIPQ